MAKRTQQDPTTSPAAGAQVVDQAPTTASAPVSGSTEATQAPTDPTTASAPVSGSTETNAQESVLDKIEDDVEGAVKDMITVIVPKAYQLRASHHQVLDIKSGIQEMERWVAEHWWSKAQGVKKYTKGA